MSINTLFAFPESLSPSLISIITTIVNNAITRNLAQFHRIQNCDDADQPKAQTPYLEGHTQKPSSDPNIPRNEQSHCTSKAKVSHTKPRVF